MAYNIHISGPKMIMHNKTIAEMFINQLNNNEGLFGVRYLILYDDYGHTYSSLHFLNYNKPFMYFNIYVFIVYTDRLFYW